MNYRHSQSGFTLIELMVTISLIIVFVSMAVSYNRTADQQIALYREQGRVANAIYQARSMAIATFNRNTQSLDACGYGIHVASSTSLMIFKDLTDPLNNNQCKDYANLAPSSIYTGSDEDVNSIPLEGVTISQICGNGNSICYDVNNYPVDFLFVPPNPNVFSNISFPIVISLHAPGVSSDLGITINQFGQISVQ
jgi:prepilin-type N-terminal cleavage/methylation domain-containing protein